MALDPITAALSIGEALITRLWPDPTQAAAAKLELVKLQASGELAQLTAETDLAKGQLAVNTAEAGSRSLFIAGWRPAIGWVCAAALLFQYIGRPMALAYHPGLVLPGLDDTLWQLMIAMLGLGSLRSFEKVRGVAN
jgi:hypothetical protein